MATQLESSAVMGYGTLSILNAGMGDIRLSFDTAEEEEVARARKIVTDLLAQGYAIVVVEEDGTHSMVRDFDPESGEYLIGSRDKSRVTGAGEGGRASGYVGTEAAEEGTPPATPEKKKRGGRRVKAGKVKATAVAPSAGG